MPAIDVSGAAERLLGYKDIIRSHCLMYVSRAIRNGEPPLNWAGLTTAWNCWQFNAGDKHTSRDVPKGFPAFLGVKRGNADGDVVISRGDGTFAATDHPWGQVGICTLAERETETGRKFVGWAGELFGYTLTNTTTASLDATPITEENDMPSLKRIFFDQGDNAAPGFASTAIYNETVGFVKTSDGRGGREKLEAYSAIGGVLGFNVTEVHVNADGWTLAQLFSDPESAASIDITALATQLAAQIGKSLADVTADELAERLAK